jgi:lysyl-tRNA synthetase class 2
VERIGLRAELLASLRKFFSDRQVLEVETPLLSSSAAVDPYLSSFPVQTGSGMRYLQTSPEFAMKRLLAAGTGPIYQICKAFRAGESGTRHNPEFTMLEWYRPGFDLGRLMDEVEELVNLNLHRGVFQRSSYRTLFETWYGANPHSLDLEQLRLLALEYVALTEGGLDFKSADLQRSFFLDLLISHGVETRLTEPTFVFDFPVQQAALAMVSRTPEGDLVARRFELYLDGLELANGYLELSDSAELVNRLRRDNERRRLEGLPEMPPAPELAGAMNAGIPDCCGVALGVDRLLMLMAGADSLDQVVSFPFNIA